MKLIIPMAGRGTRVRPHSHTVPKPLLPVAGTMIIERLVETFIRTLDREITEIVYILGPDFGNQIKDDLTAMSSRHNVKATFRVQESALGTAHAVYCAKNDLDGEVIVAFADTLFDSKDTFNIEDADSVIWLKKLKTHHVLVWPFMMVKELQGLLKSQKNSFQIWPLLGSITLKMERDY